MKDLEILVTPCRIREGGQRQSITVYSGSEVGAALFEILGAIDAISGDAEAQEQIIDKLMIQDSFLEITLQVLALRSAELEGITDEEQIAILCNLRKSDIPDIRRRAGNRLAELGRG